MTGMEFSLKNIEEQARTVLDKIKTERVDEGAFLLLLSGELGAGKTTFVQALGRVLGVKERLVSPTFLIQKEYETKDKTFRRLVHIDAYRLKSKSELEELGWKELVSDPETLVVVEWPEQVGMTGGTRNVLLLTFEHVREGIRRATFRSP